jgi:hypothetical protein
VVSDLTLLMVRDFAMVDSEVGFLLPEAFFSVGRSGVADLYLYITKSGSLSGTKTS